LQHWDLRDSAGQRVPPGLYLMRLTQGSERRTQRVAVLD
jgi:hypothetical protein